MSYSLISFSKYEYDFVRLVSNLLEVDDLSKLDEQHEGLFEVGKDSITSYHDKFYNKYRSGWPEMEQLYMRFIEEVVAPRYNEDILYQAFPTVRFHLKNNVAVGAFHTDAEFNHPKGEINYIIPLTRSIGNASVWVQKEVGSNDYATINLIPGHLVQFDGNALRHGNKVNDTGETRVSMDFRVLPISMYKEDENNESITTKTKFRLGAYYKLHKK